MGPPAANRVNDILVESQKMIYAPPSREKSKQTMRSPMIDKNGLNMSTVSHNHIGGTVSAFGAGTTNPDEYLMSSSIYSGGGGMMQATNG